MTNYPIPGNSDLTVQFNEVEIARTKSNDGTKGYRLIARGEALGSRWQEVSPSRRSGTFSFDSITGKSSWRDLFGGINPNSLLTSDGRSISFETGPFRQTRNGDYVSRIRLNQPTTDNITGLWQNASLFIDPTDSDSPADSGTITGFGLVPTPCNGSSINPVIITNYDDYTQTGSITVNPGLSSQVGVFTNATDAQNSQFGQCSGGTPDSNSAYQQNFTLQPGQSAIYYLGMGGGSSALDTTSKNIAIGGLPAGTTNSGPYEAAWYDFWLTLTYERTYDKLTLNYNLTGGPAPNGQQGFNVTMVTQTLNSDGSTTFQNSQNIISPWSNTNTNGSWNGEGEPVIYWTNQPIGLAWVS